MSGQDDEAAAELAALRADRDRWRNRCLEAEQIAEDLASHLAAARADVTAAAEAHRGADSGGALPTGSTSTGDGTDPGILVVGVGATAVVSVMVVALVVLNGELLSVGGAMTVLIAAGLLWATRRAWELRGPRARVDDGVVVVRGRDGVHRFDLRREATKVRVVGEPGDRGWRVVLERRGLDDLVVTPAGTDPEAFTAALRRWRPDL
ncbi:hypothetical protein [Nocardioides sp. AX2bis]|uniref:hypothetical protein n=1 Tax=Nocardioides sp. AX2bis TaxID=2653157 RepID=UPI0012F31508|nr:hypothetical protein [Nocardioides sp. AX2bis]VXC46038.1 conserved hypothetical protein [Nocardioides sp. AX2bis]